jgi:prophage maintenance system killer protein
MILFDLVGEVEADPVYQELAVANGHRQFDFLKSVVDASLKVGRPFLSSHVIKALNFHAITCLHTNAGEYRPCKVVVGTHEPPEHYRLAALMDDFVNLVNRHWNSIDSVVLAAFVLWRLNWIHPFINGNGRTARATCYFVLCLASGKLLPGTKTLPELIVRERPRYVEALRKADQGGEGHLGELHALLVELLSEQLASAEDPGMVAAPAEPPQPGAAAAQAAAPEQ